MDENVACVNELEILDPASDKSNHAFCVCKLKKEGSMQINGQCKVNV